MQGFELYIAIAACLVPSILIARIILKAFCGRGAKGIVLRAPNCPMCAADMPVFRLPTSLRQALFGGWTCKACGTEIDRLGRARMRQPAA